MTYSPTLLVYFSWTAVALVLNLIVLWMWSGVARARSGTASNPEDGRAYGKPVQPEDPPDVARALRAHANAAALSYPFLTLGAAYVLLNGQPRLAAAVFAVFCAARIVHSVAYLRALQPARSISFALSLFALLTLAVAVGWRAIAVAAAT